MKKCSIIAIVLSLVLLLSGCSGLGIDIDKSLTPPKPSGEVYEIQKALEKYVNGELNLVYPTSGEYRSAIITKDIDADGEYEVFSFYKTETDDKVTVMHINYIRKVSGKWVSVSDLQVDCAGVESVQFVRLDKTNTLKILVNWNSYSVTEKVFSFYSTDSGELVQEMQPLEYAANTIFDYDDDGIYEILVLAKGESYGLHMWSFMNGKPETLTECQLSRAVDYYYTPTVSRLPDGKKAIFIDGVKSNGIITEVLYLDRNRKLTSLFPYTANHENAETFRASSVRSRDYNGDGCIDIPLTQKLPMVQNMSEEDSAYLTVWNSITNNTLTPIGYNIINYTDGYYFNVPENWINNIAVERRREERLRIFSRWDPLTMTVGEEVLRIQVINLKDWTNNPEKYEGYREYMRTEDSVYIIKYGNSALTPETDYFETNLKPVNSNERDITD